MGNLKNLREKVFNGDDKACFIERERILARLEKEMQGYDKADRYAVIFSKLLAEVSVPIDEDDYFAGKAVEATPDEGMNAPSVLLCSTGHMSYHYEDLLEFGLCGMLKKIKAEAVRRDDPEAKIFAENAEIVTEAVRSYAERYAEAAEKKGFFETAKALKKVPYEPAYDFYSALQSVWLVHFIASCYVGSRDYAFGRFDEYLFPYYKQALVGGASEEYLTGLLAGFFMKTNEICGRCTHNYKTKPVLCQASKQYVCIGGDRPNAFSNIVLRAAEKNRMAQPQIIVRLKADADEEFTKNVFHAASVLTDKLQVYNYDLIVDALKKKGICEEVAKDFTYSACCGFDLHYRSYRLEYYVPAPQIFSNVLKETEYRNIEEVKNAFSVALFEDMQRYTDGCEEFFKNKEFAYKHFVFDGLFLTDSAYRCRFACDGTSKYTVFNLLCPGIASIGDSLMCFDKLVFRDKKLSYGEFVKILQTNFEGKEDLRREILSFTKFGNDTDVDLYTRMAGDAFLCAVNKLRLKQGRYAIGGFYSLERENSWKDEVGAMPNGKKAGEPFSENQSPSYGADKNGITSLLKSVSKLPFSEGAVSGGLNVTFAKTPREEILRALVLGYFELGGLHVGAGVADADTLRDAMKNPEKYPTLTVRLYGFSEYFVSLPKWQQIAILNRTAYGV